MTPEIKKALTYGSELHKKLERVLRERLRMSERKFSNRYGEMAKNEELFQAYIPTRDVDRLRKRNRDSGIPEYTTVEMPYAYSVLMTTHTYYTSVFCARNPVLQLSGRHGESEQNVQSMETLMAYQMSVGQMLLPMFIWLLDPGKYGYGVVGHHWDVERVRCRKFVDEQPTFFGLPIPGAKPKKVPKIEDLVGYQGNRTYNVRPQDFFPDPRVALIHFQKGEFCARYTEIAWNEIFEGSRHDEGEFRFFNYEKLHSQRRLKDHDQNAGEIGRDSGSSNVTELPGTGTNSIEGFDVPVGFVKGHEIYLKLTPKEWRLGDGSKQEIWVFNLSTSGVVFGAQPLGELHGKFPFDVITDEIDGYTLFPKSTIERIRPLNDIMTWLINQHFYNVRAALNNQFLYDPSRVVSKDIENPWPGKAIRLRPTAYGQDVRTMLQQLPVADVTRGHFQDLQMVMDMVQRMVPANDSMMGIQPSGSNRQTATSVRTSTHFGTSRLKTQCEWWSATGFAPYTQKLVQRTQQHFDAQLKLRIVGDLAQFSQGFIDVDPQSIAGFYDYEPVDGTLPIDRFAQANLWQMIMGQMGAYPQILATYDIAKIFAWVAQLAGIKNLAQFRLTPDAMLMQQAQAGNVVPISTAMKEVPGPKGNPNEPKQSPLAGPTG